MNKLRTKSGLLSHKTKEQCVYNKVFVTYGFHMASERPSPLKPKKIRIKKKMKIIAGDIIILHMCTENHNHIRYGF